MSSAKSDSGGVPAIEVRHLSKTFGNVRAISDVSFAVQPGEIVGFLGPNGAGKSTTMRVLAGLTQADRGVARICGVSVATEALRAKARLGYMPENNPLPEELRVIEYLRWRAKLKNVPRREIAARTEAAMEACDLARKARRKLIGALSKGFRQRVGIADALISEPDVVILDEPTIGLDPHQILGIRSLIRSLRGRKAVLISSHILPEIENVCDRVIIINGGRIVAAGTPQELRGEFIRARTFRAATTAPAEKIAEAAGGRVSVEEIAAESGGEGGMRVFEARVPAEEEIRGEAIVEALVRGGFAVRDFHEKRPTLEDIFIAATKRSYDVKE